MDRASKKSLAIPKTEPPAEYRAYVEHPEVATLNQIMLHYLDIEEILKLYRQNHEQFETRQALNTLATRFNLPAATNFRQLLQNYDMKHATVRSYLYNNRTPEETLLQAALEGNIQAFYNQLKLYPELRDKEVYTEALASAAKGGHEVIIELLLELGAEDSVGIVFTSAADGCQLALMQKELAKGIKAKYVELVVKTAALLKHRSVVEKLLDYSTTDLVLIEAMAGAGQSGDITIIEYIISRGGNDYLILIHNAVMYGHFDVVMKYWDKLTRNYDMLNESVLYNAFNWARLDAIKFLVERRLVSRDRLQYNLSDLKYRRIDLLRSKQRVSSYDELERVDKDLAALDSIITYLETKGIAVNVDEGYNMFE